MNHPTGNLEDMRIVVAEDSATQREQICIALESKGCQVFALKNGEEALDACREYEPDVVISDIVMPGMDGYELCTKIKKDRSLSKIAVVLVTSLSNPADVMRGLECGADNFIIKPYEERYLLNRLTQLWTNRKLAPDEPLGMTLQISFGGQQFYINSDRLQILNLLLTTYETAVQRNSELERVQKELRQLTESLEQKVSERTAKLEAEVQERSRAENALRQQTGVLQSIVHSMADALLVTDEKGQIELLNPAARNLLGIKEDDQLPSEWPSAVSIYSDDGLTLCPEEGWPVQCALRGEQRPPVDLILKRDDGSEFYINAKASPITGKDGEICGCVLVLRDTTTQKKMERQVLRSQRMESVGTLAGGVAHDLNNVLAPILMASEILERKIEGDKNLNFIRMISKSATRGSKLVKQLLTFARGTGDDERKTIPLVQLIKELGNVAMDTFPKNISIRLDLDENLWMVNGDSTQLDQVFLNLCVNARDAMPDGGFITIAAKNIALDELEISSKTEPIKAGEYVCVSVSDTGTGIPKVVLDRIFEPFFTTKEPGKGTGLGLSTVLGIVKSHGGFIEIDTKEGRGTTFKVYLPPVKSGSEAAETDPKETLPLGNGELILIADDEEAVRDTVAMVLTSQGYRVVLAEDGISAVAQFAQNQADISLVITDLVMPNLDGIHVAKAVNRMRPGVPVVLSSGGHDRPIDAETKAQLGIKGHLAKPYNSNALLKCISDTINLNGK